MKDVNYYVDSIINLYEEFTKNVEFNDGHEHMFLDNGWFDNVIFIKPLILIELHKRGYYHIKEKDMYYFYKLNN